MKIISDGTAIDIHTNASSTEETIVGTYLGQPRYRRVYQAVCPSTNVKTTLVERAIPEGATCVWYEFTVQNPTYGNLCGSWAYGLIYMNVDLDGNVIAWETDSRCRGLSVTITVEYIKGEVSSTEETIVGTWLGQPRYRKVYQATCPTTSSETIVIEHAIPEGATCVHYEFAVQNPTYGTLCGSFTYQLIYMSVDPNGNLVSWATDSRTRGYPMTIAVDYVKND